jgi:hypothetical protein
VINELELGARQGIAQRLGAPAAVEVTKDDG